MRTATASRFVLTLSVAMLAAPAAGQTVHYDIRPAGGAASPVQVGYNATVDYQVTISVSDGDNDGLLFFGFDIVTDLGVIQSVDGIVWDSVILTYFDFLGGPFPGTPNDDGVLGNEDDDDIIFFSGTQGFAFNAEPGIAQPGPQVMVRGPLQTEPGVLGTFSVTVANSLTQLFGDTDSDGTPDIIPDTEFTTTFGPGFQIEVLPDADSDGVPDILDACPGADDNADADSDGVPDDCDPCPNDNPDDSDADGVCDSDDVCPGFDDAADGDSDGAPDGCDPCPADNPDDTDSDGVCDSIDICPGFDDGDDADADGTPDGCDTCPLDNPDDTDSDGVCDSNDPCPNDNPDDSDGDGVCNSADGCPSNANKVAPGQCGCGAADTDADGDGTADCNDQCPTNPNKIAPGQCGCNILDRDSDGDGVANCIDNCPTVKNGGQLDSNGDGVGDACTPAAPGPNPDDIPPAAQGCGAGVGMINLGAFWCLCLLGLIGLRRRPSSLRTVRSRPEA